jgi:flagellar basal body-associated protein FliL
MGTLARRSDAEIRLGGTSSRNLLILSLVMVMLLPAYNGAFIYPSLTKLFAENIAKDATNIAKHFSSMLEERTTELTRDVVDYKIVKAIDTLKDDFGLAKLKIFSKSGEILFSTSPEEIGNINIERYFHDIVAQGGIYTKLINKNAESLEHQRMFVDVVETYVPMMKDGVFQGALEIYYDITEKKRSLDRLLLISFGIVIVLGLAVLTISIVNFVKERRTLVERKKAEDEREKLIVELQDALAEVGTLSGLLPICASCKKIRDDQGYWNQIEDYISSRSEASFSHGICPDCAKKLYSEYYRNK